MTKFVILTTQRSGSTVLTRTLDEHSEIFCAGEIFLESNAGVHHPEWHFPNWSVTGKKQSKLNKLVNWTNLRLNAVKHIKSFYGDLPGGTKAKGFKLMYSHVKSAPFIWEYMRVNKVKVIVLIRDNAFRMALSRFKMSKTGVAHSDRVAGGSNKVKVPVQPLLQETMRLQQVNKKLLELSAGTDRLIISYKDFNDWNSLLLKIFTFLNVSVIHLPPVLKKVSAEDWRDDVENFLEIESVFKAHQLDTFLDNNIL